MARAAEEAGFDSIWMGDHLLYRGDGRPERGPWEAWTMLAGLAAATERVALGPLVASAAFHAPAMLAKLAATVDEISGGRLVLGIGAGWNETEFRAFGFPYDRRVDRFEEAFGIVRRLLAGERVTNHGTYHDVEDVLLLPAPARRPPIMIGSSGERMLRIALPHAQAWNVWWDLYGNTPEGFAAESAMVSRIAGSLGLDPAAVERSACVLVVLDREAGERPVPDDCRPLEGSAADIAEGLRAMAEAGADEAILVVSPITERSVQALADVLVDLDA
jgi:probable F420-dependent oxidoreductase